MASWQLRFLPWYIFILILITILLIIICAWDCTFDGSPLHASKLEAFVNIASLQWKCTYCDRKTNFVNKAASNHLKRGLKGMWCPSIITPLKCELVTLFWLKSYSRLLITREDAVKGSKFSSYNKSLFYFDSKQFLNKA